MRQATPHAAPVFDPVQAGRATLAVLADGAADAAALAQRQADRLAALLAAVRRDSRLYAELHRGADDRTPLSALPVVGKRMLMQRFDDWVGDPALRLTALRDFVADPTRAADAMLGRYTVWESSGTSGEPGMFVQDAHAMAVYDALEWLRRANPLSLGDPLQLMQRQALVVATGGHFASHVSLERLRRLNPWLAATLRGFSILQPGQALFEALEAFQPAVLATYPTAAAMLGDAVERGALRLALHELHTGGETLGDAVRARLERQFGCRVRNHYGASEFLAMGWECTHGRLHLNTDWFVLEPVDRRGRPVPPGQMSYTTLLTNLANAVQPLIRYDLGDQVLWHEAPCTCGSALPTVTVLGRRDEALVMRGDDGRRVTLLPLALTTVLEDDAGVFDFQLRQRDARTLHLRLGGDADGAARERCHRALAAYAAAQGLSRLVIVDEPGAPLAHGRSGKVQRVVAAHGAAAR